MRIIISFMIIIESITCIMFNTVICILKCDGLAEFQKNFLSQMFGLKTNDEININKLLINLSFETRIRRPFGEKPHSLLIYYKSDIKLKPLNTDFIKIINSIDDAEEYEKLNKDTRFFTIGNSVIAKLDTKTSKKINQLIAPSQSDAATISQKSNKSPKNPCYHYKSYKSPS